MKIGTITFHWATNYGAVLQAYALQHYLKRNRLETEIINYIPFRVKLIQVLSRIKHLEMSEFIRENKINSFRKQFLNISAKTYYTNNSLIKRCHDYDVYICGSDQIWNESFTLKAEGKPTLSYYLNFVKNEKRRISYAASFGANKLSTKVINLVKPELKKFHSISVREKTGEKIIQNMGFKATLVADPTLLLDKEAYECLIEKKVLKEEYQLFSYILHKNQATANAINEYIFDKFFNKNLDRKYNKEPIGIFEWLYNVRNSRLVVTNSFHGTIFAILFHTPFIVVPVENSGMNNRITTLLNVIGLSERIINTLDETEIDRLLAEDIDWRKVDDKVEDLRAQSIQFLEKSLGIYK
jgi:polysaccharide pyruvyl transferase WcaK-like protein